MMQQIVDCQKGCKEKYKKENRKAKQYEKITRTQNSKEN